MLYSTEIGLADIQDMESALEHKISYYEKLGDMNEVENLKIALDVISDLEDDLTHQYDDPPKTFCYVVDYDETEAWGCVCARNEKEAEKIVRHYYMFVDNVCIFAYRELIEDVCLDLGEIDECGSGN